MRRQFIFKYLAINDVVCQNDIGRLWRSIGDDPSFELTPPRGRFPNGWVLINARIERRTTDYTAKLYVDIGHGISEDRVFHLPISRKGVLHEMVRLPRGVKRLRWDPMQAPGELIQSPIVMTEIGRLERWYRMTRRIVPMLWIHPRSTLEPLGLSWWRLFTDLRGAYRAAGKLRAYAPAPEYALWVNDLGMLSDDDRNRILAHLAALMQRPLISVILPVFNPQIALLRRAIESVRAQLYPHWELCIADDASTDPEVGRVLREYTELDERIRLVVRSTNGHISAASNSALALAHGEFVALLDQDDELAEHALYTVACEINSHPQASLIYSDEDKITEDGQRCEPNFKPDWNLELLYSQNYLCHLLVLRHALVESVGGFREGYEGSQDYDLALRCIARSRADQVRHIPTVLYHWRLHPGSTSASDRNKDYASRAGLAALRDHFAGQPGVQIKSGVLPTTYHVRFPVPEPAPKVSLIIPTRDQATLLKTCVESILERTKYPNFELVLVDNQSTEPEALAYLDELTGRSNVRVLKYDAPFNYSAINNFAVRQCDGALLGLVNNDIEVISPEWLTEMVGHALRMEVGAVGAKLYYGDNCIQHAGVIVGLGGVAGHAHKYYPRDAHGHGRRLVCVQAFSAVTGACLILRRNVYEEVGGLNEQHLKVAFNDVDLCLKIQRAGYRNVWTPFAELYHHESVSRGQDDSEEKKTRSEAEVTYMRKTWGAVLEEDPYYNPNLTRNREDFSLAEVSRYRRPWREERRG